MTKEVAIEFLRETLKSIIRAQRCKKPKNSRCHCNACIAAHALAVTSGINTAQVDKEKK